MGYSGSITETYRLAGVSCRRCFSRRKQLPVQQGTKVQLFLNLKTAKALGLDIPTDAARACRRGDRIGPLSLLHCMKHSGYGRYCCKSPKLPGANFPAVKKSD